MSIDRDPARGHGRILLTGGTGFIGSHLSRRLRAEGYELHFLLQRDSKRPNDVSYTVADLGNRAEVSAVFEKVRPQYLVHLAARAEPSRHLEDLESYYESNVRSSLNLARCAPTDLRLAVFVGSCEEYGDGPVPFRETQRPEAFSPYGWSKISANFGVELVARQRKLAWTWLRPFLTFGPGQSPRALIPFLIDSLRKGKSVPLTPGEQTRDFIYVDDLCEMFVRVLANPDKASGKTFNLCSGVPRRVRDVAEEIQRLVGKGSLDFGAIPYREREAMEFYGSDEAFSSAFGRVPQVDFEKAISSTLGVI